MALAKKGTRRISVDGQAYRWVVSPDDGYMVLVVELAENPGQRLIACFDYQDIFEPAGPGRWRIVGQRISISPGVVRSVIEAALISGWRPSVPGLREFRLDPNVLGEIQTKATE